MAEVNNTASPSESSEKGSTTLQKRKAYRLEQEIKRNKIKQARFEVEETSEVQLPRVRSFKNCIKGSASN